MSIGDGGGPRVIDVPRTMTLGNLEARILDRYLPGGKNLVQGLLLAECELNLATFNSGRLPKTIDGIPF